MVATPVWSIAAIASVASLVVAIFGGFVAFRALRHNTRAMEVQILQNIFHAVSALDHQYLAEFHELDGYKKNAWSASFFNTVEYLCFVVNHRITRHKKLEQFFFSALPDWRKRLDEHAEKGFIRNAPDMFPEFKKAAQKLTQS